MNATNTRVVIVDDDPQFLKLMEQVAASQGFHADTYTSVKDFWQHPYGAFDMLMLDLSMPGCDGIEFIRQLALSKCDMQIVLCSGQDQSILKAAQDLVIAHKLNFLAALQKPVSPRTFKQLLRESKAGHLQAQQQQQEFEVTASRLSQALENGELLPHFQPQVDLATGEVLGFEALCRWLAPERGLISPAQFLPVAQKNQLLSVITRHMLQQSTEIIARTNQALNTNFHVSINIDASDASSLNFPEFVEQIVTASGMKPNQVMLEITESGMMGRMTDSLDILARLRMKGVNLSIDDFGTGYSSLAMLHKLPFNELKIDQSFVRCMNNDKTSRAIVETSILLANKIGVITIAEGIEDQITFTELKAQGCQIGQGYFIGKPMQAEDIPAWLPEWRQHFAKFDQVTDK